LWFKNQVLFFTSMETAGKSFCSDSNGENCLFGVVKMI